MPAGVVQAVELERLGFDAIWVPDSQLLWRDTWVSAAAIAAATNSVRIGTAVTNPVTRTAEVTASAAVSLDELSERRFRLGIGTGDSATRVTGGSGARLRELRSAVELIGRLTAGEWVSAPAQRVRLKAAEHRTTRVPLYLGAAGPRMLQLAAELADGVILLTGNTPASLDYAFDNMAIGAERAGREVADLHVVLAIRCRVAADRAESERLARPFAAKYAIRSPETLRAAGIVPVAAGRADTYPDLAHAEDWEQAIELTSWIPDDVLRAFCDRHMVIGTADEVSARLGEFIRRGITSFMFIDYASYDPPMALARELAASVLPRWR
ncbi:LLM class flavin-dependent oxidoreductase [Actinophytocola sp.]|uniref:LLM class flavin-dependent oxidoreductase n=1 Tax=Actinophytocola sp. TaxID=1872138 RepID=UPI003D6B9A16